MEQFSDDMPWVIFQVKDRKMAISTKYVREMVVMPSVTSIPRTPDYVRGVINLRGQVIPVTDLRLRLGMESQVSELDALSKLLEQREQDHRNWLKELENSVKEKREFKLTTDPHQCAFGRWYDNYTSKSPVISNFLKKFDEPHKKIHRIAINVEQLVANADYNGALQVIDNTRDTDLATMICLFAELRELIYETNREIAVVLEYDENIMTIGVDSVATVEKFSEKQAGMDAQAMQVINNNLVSGIGQLGNSELVLVLNIRELLGRIAEITPEPMGEQRVSA